jgi:hypothetical protein
VVPASVPVSQPPKVALPAPASFVSLEGKTVDEVTRMKKIALTIPQLALIVGTRAMAAAGVALLLGDRLDRRQRRAVGATLAAVGALTTFPLAAEVVSAARAQRRDIPEPPTIAESPVATERQNRATPLAPRT